MWNELVKNLANYSSAVITGVDSEGYPYSVRCNPQVDHARRVLLVQIHPEAMIQAGPAGLLCHSHDEFLWNIKNFIVHGTLEQSENSWIFHPIQFVPGAGDNSPLAMITYILNARRATSKYLKKRGLSRPTVPWEELKALRAEAKKTQLLDRQIEGSKGR